MDKRKVYFHSENNALFIPSAGLPQVIYMTKLDADLNWKYAAHKHDDFCEICYIYSGKGYYVIDNKRYAASKGDIIVFNQGIVHSEQSDEDDLLGKWVCAVKSVHILNQGENRIIPIGMLPVISMGKNEEIVNNLFEIIMNACQNPSKYSFAICQFSIASVISLIYDIITPSAAMEKSSEDYTLGDKIRQYIDMNYTKQISLETIAHEFYVSPDYLSHVMKQEFGISPINYVINRRIGEAQRLLLSTMLPVTEIAEMVGYPNLNHFSNAFKGKLGISPTQFRGDYNVSCISSKGSDIHSIHLY